MSTFTPKLRLWPGVSSATDASEWGLGVDITSYVRRPGNDGGQPITYSAGRQDEGNQIDAGVLNVTVDNRTGIWSPKNVNGTYYGQLTRNTPIQLSTDTGSDTFNRTAGANLGTSSSGQLWTVGGGWTTDGTAGLCSIGANSISRATLADADAWNFDIRYTCWVGVVATGASLMMIGAGRYLNVNDSALFRVEFNTAGTVDLRVGRRSLAGFTITGQDDGVFAYAANTKVRTRCQGDGQAMRMKAWIPANPASPDADEPATWNVVTTDTESTGTGVGLFAWRVFGNTNVGTPGIYVDDFISSAEEWTGSVVQWPARWSMTGTNSWVPIQAAGPLRRMRQGRGQLQSPLRRQLASYDPAGFWPLEDEAGSTLFASAISGQQPAVPYLVTAGAVDDLPGASRAVVFDTASSTIDARTTITRGNTGFAAMFLFKLQALPGGTTLLARYRSGGRITKWEVSLTPTSIVVNAYEGNDASPTFTDNSLYGVNPLEWVACQLEATYTGGGGVAWAFITHQVGDVTYYAQSGSYGLSTVPTVSNVRIGGTDLDGAAFSMIYLGQDTLPFVDDTFSLVSAGYAGELAADRAARVASEAGLSLLVEPGDSEPMGAQREGTILEVLRSCEAADYGILYENGSGLGFRPRTARYNKASTLTLSMVAGHIGATPEAEYDDQKLRNVWTVSRIGGSSATAVDDASVAEDGEVADSASINVATDEVLPNHAGWRTFIGVQDSLRWPAITLNFARNPGLLTYWRSRQYGFRFAATTGLAQVAGSEPDVIAEGFQAELHPDGWTVTLNCSGASPWDVAVLDDADARLDTAGCELTAPATLTSSAWLVTTTAGPAWNPSAPLPILVKCEGELMLITGISGAGPAQNLTMTRSINGVVKTHPTGATISLAYPARLAL